MQQSDQESGGQPKQNATKSRLTSGRLQAITSLQTGQQATLGRLKCSLVSDVPP